MLNKRILIFLILLIAAAVSVFFYKRSSRSQPPVPASAGNQQQKDISKDPPKIVSTKPDPLDQIIIPTDQIIEITFNRPLENAGEFKVKIEPKVEFKLELSGDRKTGRIIPVKPYELGSGYTISIGPDTKFDGVGEWGKDKSFHFRTIKYTGV